MYIYTHINVFIYMLSFKINHQSEIEKAYILHPIWMINYYPIIFNIAYKNEV